MKRALIGTFALSLAAGMAYAQDNAAAGAGSQAGAASLRFSTVDADNDGRVSSAEAQAHAALRSDFARLDANSDGYLSQAEFDKMKAGSSSSSGAGSPGAGSPDASSPRPTSPGTSSSPGSSSDNPGTRSTAPEGASPQSESSDPAE